MHITLESDYAIRIILCLARRGRRTDAGTIAEITGVSLRFALKILRNLVGSGMVRSFKGIQGGYELNHDPADITLKDILEVVEGEYHLSRCLGGECCNVQSSKGIRRHQQDGPGKAGRCDDCPAAVAAF